METDIWQVAEARTELPPYIAYKLEMEAYWYEHL